MGASIKDRDPHQQLGDLTLSVPSIDSLAQSTEAVHFDLHKAASMVAASLLSY